MNSHFSCPLMLANALLLVSVAMRVQAQRVPDELGVSGSVIAPDGTPISAGSVVIQSPSGSVTTSIERPGHFHFVPSTPGLHRVFVNVAGLAPYRVHVVVPPSRTVSLPQIQLSPATYFRVRLVSADGEPISPRFRRQSLDLSGMPLPSPLTDRISDEIDSDGTAVIGPLPRGITTLAFDAPPFAQTRLPDVFVTGKEELLDGGTVVIQPGSVLQVDVVDASGAPVPQHAVVLEDAMPLSPLGPRTIRTDQQGRATFDRLGRGRYRVRTSAVARCANRLLTIGRASPVSGSGTVRTRLIVGGSATFRVTSPLGPLRGALVSASPDTSPSPPPGWLREGSDFSPMIGRPLGPFAIESACAGTTDAEGRVTLTTFPPGPARVEVHLLNSVYVRRVGVPDDGRETAIVIPDGFLPVRVTNAITHEAVAAAISWTGSIGRVQAAAAGNGEALLEGVGTNAGTLAITAPRYKGAEMKLQEPPAMLQEVALMPAPVTTVTVQVRRKSGQALPNAVVELFPENPFDIPEVATTDAKGLVSFTGAPPGMLRLTAFADGFEPATVRIGDDKRSGVVLTLSAK